MARFIPAGQQDGARVSTTAVGAASEVAGQRPQRASVQAQALRTGTGQRARFFPSQPPQTDADIASQRSQARAPGNIQEPADTFEPSTRQVARDTGVGLDEAPFGSQFRFGLGSPAMQEPEQQMELARRVLGDQADDVRIGPDTGEVEYRRPGEEQYNLFNVPGPSLGDVTRFAPEAGVIGGGIAGGVLGGAGGAAVGGAPGGTAGVIAGEGAGEGLSQAIRLTSAAERGDIDLTPDQIIQQSIGRGGEAAVGTAVGGAALRALRSLIGSRLGVDSEVLEAMGDRPVSEIRRQADEVRQSVQAETGEDLPLTMGQLSRNPELLRAESAARTSDRGAAAPFQRTDREQRRVMGDLERQTFGEPVSVGERETIGREALRASQRVAQGTREDLQRAEQGAFGTAQQTDDAVSQSRRLIESGREEVFRPLQRQFDELQREQGFQVDLTPVRQEASRLRSEEGQNILRSVSLQNQSALLSEAERAGLRDVDELQVGDNNLLEFVQRSENQPRSLGEIQRTLRDIRRELRRPGMADEPQKQRILSRVEKSMVDARNRSLPEDARDRVLAMEAEYAQRVNQLDRGIVSDFLQTDPQTGVARLSGPDAVNRLLRGRQNAEEFTTALGSLPNSEQIQRRVQDGILGDIRSRATNAETGEIDPTRLNSFLQNRGNREAMEVMFQDRPNILKQLGDTKRLAKTLKDQEQQLQNVRDRMRRLTGLDSADPAAIAKQVLSSPDPQVAQRVRRSLPEDRRELYDRALSSNVRDSFLNRQGQIDAGEIDAFLKSDRSRVTRQVLGERFNQRLGTLRDAIRQTSQDMAGEPAPNDLSQMFTQDSSSFSGLMRFLRVPLGVMTVRSRAATAAMGFRQEQSRQRLAEVLADPNKLKDLSELTKLPLRSRRADLILGRLGFGAYQEARDGATGEDNAGANAGGTEEPLTIDVEGQRSAP